VKNKIFLWKKFVGKSLLILGGISCIGAMGCIVVLIPAIRSIIITHGETLVRRQLNHEVWNYRLLSWAATGLFDSLILVFVVLRKHSVLRRIIALLKKWLNNHVRLIITLFFMTMAVNFLFFLDLPVAKTGLDSSWLWALNNVAYNQSYTFGSDITFTYGPLGYLLVSENYSNIIIQGIVLNISCIFVIMFLFYLNYNKKSYSLRKIFIFSMVLFVFPGMPSFEWVWNIMLFLLFFTCWVLREEKYAHTLLFISAGVMSAFSLLLKFNTAVFAVAIAGVLGIMFLLYDRKRSIQYIYLFSIAYIIFTAGSIAIFFESIHNFIHWIEISLEISGGYSAAMATYGPPHYLFAALLIIILFLHFFYLQRKEAGYFVLCALGMVAVFFSFKHGFVRQDGHMLSLFATMPFLTGFLFLFSPDESYRRSFIMFRMNALLCFLALINYFGINFAMESFLGNAYAVTQLKKNYMTFNERKIESMREDVLPDEWNAEIGNNSIQILPWELSYAEANQWERWHLNPVFQLYSAYTKKLDEYSASSFAPEKAPDLILLEYKAIDGRNMFLDTPAIWNVILPNYTIVKQDNRRLLLSRRKVYRLLQLVPIDSNTYKFNDVISVPESTDPLYAKILIKDTFLGTIITTLFRGDPSRMTIIYNNENTQHYRVIEDTLQNPVLINYIPTDFEQMGHLFNFEETGEDLNPLMVKAIRFSSRIPFLHKNSITIEWFRAVNE
jgi:hypothetical protein